MPSVNLSKSIAIGFLLALGAVPCAAQQRDPLPPGTTNAPPTVVGDLRRLLSGSTLNVLPGGSVGADFSAGAGSQVNISGGSVGRDFRADSGSQVNISGGSVGVRFQALAGSHVTIAGGEVGNDFEAGRFFGSDSVVNVDISGGTVGSRFVANDKAIVTISGGSVGSFFEANDGSQVNLTGGVLGHSFHANSGSVLNISGGSTSSIGAAFGSVVNITGGEVGSTFAGFGSTVNVSGGVIEGGFDVNRVNIRGGRFEVGADVGNATVYGSDFLVNGVAAEGQVSLGPTDVLTGVLEDGTPFIFSPIVGDDGSYSLTPVTTPTYSTSPIVIDSPSDFPGLRSGQHVTVAPGGRLGRALSVVNATLDVNGGEVDRELKAVNSQINVSAGEIAGDLVSSRFAQAHFIDTEVNVTGGRLGHRNDLYGASVLNLSQGSVGDNLRIGDGSTLTTTGGAIGSNLWGKSGSQVNLAGGTIGRIARFDPGSSVNLEGGEFLLNGVAPSETTLTLGDDDVLTGTLGDGSAFVFATRSGDQLTGVNLVEAPLPAIDTTPIVLNDDNGPASLRSGQVLFLQEGGVVKPNFAAVNAVILMSGGELPDEMDLSGTTLQVAGGDVGFGLHAYNGSAISVSGGSVGEGLIVSSGSILTVTGGEIAEGLSVEKGSVLNIHGGHVEKIFSEVLLSEGSTANVTGGTIESKLRVSDSTVNISGGNLEGLVAGLDARINVSGGLIDEFEDESDSTTVVTGGAISRVDAVGRIQIFDGTVGGRFSGFNALDGSVIELLGGRIGRRFTAFAGSIVEISGGRVGDDFEASSGSTLRISGGVFEGSFTASSGSNVDISGGQFTGRFTASLNNQVNFAGGEFLLNGVAVADGSVTLSESDVLSGTLEDGSVFVFTPLLSDHLPGVTVTTTALPPPATFPIVVSGESAPHGGRPGETLTLVDGGILNTGFAASGAIVNIEGGQAGKSIRVASSTLNVSGGSIDRSLHLLAGSELNVTGGAIGDSLRAYDGATVELSGGSIGRSFAATSATVLVTGGSIEPGFRAQEGSTVRITGGTVSGFVYVEGSSFVEIGDDAQLTGSLFVDSGGVATQSGGVISGFVEVADGELNLFGGVINGALLAGPEGVVNLFGRSFEIDGVTLDGLTLNEPFLIEDRDVELAGILADGSAFSYTLNTNGTLPGDVFTPAATLTVTLLLPGDYNADGVVDATDYSVWRDNLGSAITLPGDTTPGTVSGEDYEVWRSNYGATLASVSAESTLVPEATSLLLLLFPVGLATTGIRLDRKRLTRGELSARPESVLRSAKVRAPPQR